jgi:hypothetical protein
MISMSDRSNQLLKTAEGQITNLTALLSTASEATLRSPCPGREKLGDGTIAAVATHVADTYLRIAGFLSVHREHSGSGEAGHGDTHGREHVDIAELIERLAAGRQALSPLADLTDHQLDAVPPAGQSRFCDGKRTTEEVLAAMLKHQAHQIDALTTAIA